MMLTATLLALMSALMVGLLALLLDPLRGGITYGEEDE